MFSLQDVPTRLCDGWSRRDLLQAGAASAFGLSLPDLLAAAPGPNDRPPNDRMFGRAKNLIYLYLQGGPPQHETFDPKPQAPAEIRGVHQPIATSVPGIQFCELLPRTARRAHKLAVIRSLSTQDNVHSSSGYWVLTGYKYRGANARTIQTTDWPYFGSLIKKLKPSETLPSLSTVWVPDIMRLNESVTPAGQTAGFLGGRWHPDRFVGDPAADVYEVQGLTAEGIRPVRLDRRVSLLKQVDQRFAALNNSTVLRDYDSFQRQAFELMTSGKARDAFAIDRESAATRDQYGRYTWGQCCLLARRLIEAGVRMVHVNWPREPGDNAVDNPLWDTHAQNADRLEDVLCPKFDVTFTALLDDLDQRGLLDETLVIAVGEFGRTPKINSKGGRDHWGSVFSCVLAGAGISGGQVYGESDKSGGYPIKDRVLGGDLTATIFHLLGINPLAMFTDPAGRPHRLTEGEPLFKLLGTEPATQVRQPAGGDISRMPPFNPSLLLNTRFQDASAIRGVSGPSRPQGWRADPWPAMTRSSGLYVRTAPTESEAQKESPEHVARIGLQFDPAHGGLQISAGQTAMLAQEVRSPFAGHYRLTARYRVRASAERDFEQLLAKHFTCRIAFFQFADRDKTPARRTQLAAATFAPQWTSESQSDWQTVQLDQAFVNPNPGSNFSFGNGLGVALLLEAHTSLELAASEPGPRFAELEFREFSLEFAGKARIETVKV